jgi:hypothetical protein
MAAMSVQVLLSGWPSVGPVFVGGGQVTGSPVSDGPSYIDRPWRIAPIMEVEGAKIASGLDEEAR